jgi:transglutaminase-like putative cysteine protease
MRGVLRLALAALVAVNGGAQAADEPQAPLAPLHVIPTENLAKDPVPADGPVRIRLSSPNLPELAAALHVKLPDGQTSFEYVLARYPQLEESTSRTWLESTFVIDYEEAAFDALRQELEAREKKTTRAELEKYVAGFVEPTGDRGWDLASEVARRRRGDCSEHAVLTAALARLQGIPARVVVGIALVADGSRYGTFGHAWTEVLEDGQWKVTDAALFGLGKPVRYLPLGLMEDEGMGYTMGLIQTLRIWIDRVVVLGP